MQVATLLRLSVATAVVSIDMKTAAWWITGSVGLLSDAMESFVNLASALFALAMVTIAARPADDDHPFGHTKAEYFASAFEGLMIAAAAIAIVWAALRRFMNLQPLEGVGIGLGLTVASSLLNGLLAHKMMAASRQHLLDRPRGRRAPSLCRRLDVGRRRRRRRSGRELATELALAARSGRPAICVAGQRHARGARCVAHVRVGRRPDGQGGSSPKCMAASIDRTLAQFRRRAQIRFGHVGDEARRRAASSTSTCTCRRAGRSVARLALRGEVEQALMDEVAGLRASIQLLPSNVEPHFKAASASR